MSVLRTLKGEVSHASSTTRFFFPLLAERVMIPFLAGLGGVERYRSVDSETLRPPCLTCIVDRSAGVQT